MPRGRKLLMLPVPLTVLTIPLLLTRPGRGSRIRTLLILVLVPNLVTTLSSLVLETALGPWTAAP